MRLSAQMQQELELASDSRLARAAPRGVAENRIKGKREGKDWCVNVMHPAAQSEAWPRTRWVDKEPLNSDSSAGSLSTTTSDPETAAVHADMLRLKALAASLAGAKGTVKQVHATPLSTDRAERVCL